MLRCERAAGNKVVRLVDFRQRGTDGALDCEDDVASHTQRWLTHGCQGRWPGLRRV